MEEKLERYIFWEGHKDMTNHEIPKLFLTQISVSSKVWRFHPTVVAFSEYMNFIWKYGLCWNDYPEFVDCSYLFYFVLKHRFPFYHNLKNREKIGLIERWLVKLRF